MCRLQRVCKKIVLDRTVVLSLAFVVGCINSANAGPFLDLGVAMAIDVNESMGRNCIRDYDKEGIRKSWL